MNPITPLDQATNPLGPLVGLWDVFREPTDLEIHRTSVLKEIVARWRAGKRDCRHGRCVWGQCPRCGEDWNALPPKEKT